jgi:hypothetical protein
MLRQVIILIECPEFLHYVLLDWPAVGVIVLGEFGSRGHGVEEKTSNLATIGGCFQFPAQN